MLAVLYLMIDNQFSSRIFWCNNKWCAAVKLNGDAAVMLNGGETIMKALLNEEIAVISNGGIIMFQQLC